MKIPVVNINRVSLSKDLMARACQRAKVAIENSQTQRITGLLPESMRKCKTTGLTTAQLVDLVLKNLL